MTQKGSQLTGAAVSEEVFESSDHIVAKSQHGNFKGLQQFFTPEPAARLAAYVTNGGPGTLTLPVFDPTAGDGSFLAPVPPALSFGVEIDKDQIEAAEESYQAIQGDIKKVWPLIYRVSPEFPAVWSNPPFGLKDWSDPTVREGKALGSAALAFIYATRILASDGQIVFICGRDQFHREIAPLPEAKGVYYVAEVDDLGRDNSFEHPCAIAFAVNASMREEVYDRENRKYVQTDGFETKRVPMDMLDLLGPVILEARETAIGSYQNVARHSFGGGHQWSEAWKAIGKEYDRRQRVEDGKKVKREYDVELIGGKIMNVLPSPFAEMALSKHGTRATIKGLHGKPVDYFAHYERDWKTLMEARDGGYIGVDPRVVDRVEEILHVSRRATCPRYAIKETQRLGYLSDLNVIKCKKDDGERGFMRGDSYELTTRTVDQIVTVKRPVTVKKGKNAGEIELREFEQQRKALRVTIDGKHNFYDSLDHQEDIKYLLEHFEMPNPGDVGTRYPQEVEANRQLLQEIEDDTIHPNSVAYAEKYPELNKGPVRFRKFQLEDLARGLVDESIVLAWEQGLGKTLAGLAYSEARFRQGAQKAALYVVPQDLIPQWQAESERFLGKKLELIKTHGQAKEVAKKLRLGGEGLYITYYEALAVNGTSKSEMEDEVIVETRTEMVKEKWTGRWGSGQLAAKDEDGSWVGVRCQNPDNAPNHRGDAPEGDVLIDADGNVREHAQWVPIKLEVRGASAKRHYVYIPEIYYEKVKQITSRDLCPECKADRATGWNGKFCRAETSEGSVCGYSHYKHRVKPMGSLLSTAFKHGVIAIDEGTMIQGDYSERSRVVRGLRARNKLLMTGTPVKNYIPQAFWLLWWTLGNASKRFPYDYGGKGSFENNHAVIEWAIVGGKKAARKVLPEVTNLSQLWRLLASSIIRRRKEETGEDIVRKTIHPITVPLGYAQHEQMEKWRKDFHLFFEEKYPDAPVVKAGAHQLMAPMLGLGMKLDYAATIPLGDPDWDWTQVEDVSNFTPANMRVLEITMALVKQGRKVLVGSQWIPTAAWLSEQLEAKGVLSGHLLDANGNTAPPAKRAAAVKNFQDGDMQALCVGIQAVRLGHNLDASNAVVVTGLPWDYESFDQFIARVHRLTSKRAVDVYIVIPGSNPDKDKGTITRRKWGILQQKGDAANLALDGRLIEQEEAPVSEDEVVQQMIEQGIPLVGDEIPEQDIERLWSEVSHIDHYEPPAHILEATEEVIVDEGGSKVTFDVPVYFPYDGERTLRAIGWTPPVKYPYDGMATLAAMNYVPEPVEAPTFVPFAGVTDIEAALDEPLTPDEDEMDADLDRELEPQEDPDEMVEEESDDTKVSDPSQTADPTKITAALKELAALYQADVLTHAEFTDGKADLLAQLKTATTDTQLSLV